MLLNMWTTFFPDLVVTVIGAALGSVLTVFIAAVTFLVQRRRNDIGAISNLVDDLHHRRALAVGTPRVIPSASSLLDYQRASLSVIDMRDRIREARSRIRPQSKMQPDLSTMIRACNRYLEQSSDDPTRYWFDLDELRAGLQESVNSLAAQERAIEPKQPGAAAF